jgi:hypothetical protein
MADCSCGIGCSTREMYKWIAEAKASSLARFGGYEVIQGISHDNFRDVSFMSPLRALSQSGRLGPRRAAKIINAYALAFFCQTLRNETADLLVDETRTFPEARLKLHPAAVDAWSCLPEQSLNQFTRACRPV